MRYGVRGVTAMASFDPRPAWVPHHFEVSRDGQGRWVVRDREGLVGGVFLTCEGARRFALGEAGGDPAYVHLCAEPALADGGGDCQAGTRRLTRRPSPA